MVDSGHHAESPPRVPSPKARAAGAARRRLWLAFAVLAVLAAGGAAVVWWHNQPNRTPPEPLEGELTILVRGPGRASESVPIEESGALPARPGGQMSLSVRFNRPALAYLVWIDAGGRVLPLYPWNHDDLEVKDVAQAPPTRKATTIVFSPPIGKGWPFGKKGGTHTVLLLARLAPPDKAAPLAPLLSGLPPARPRTGHPAELAVLSLGADDEAVSTLTSRDRGPEEEALAAEQPLRALLVRLRDHFELVQAVRFTQEGE
jgi:hypothetical protein